VIPPTAVEDAAISAVLLLIAPQMHKAVLRRDANTTENLQLRTAPHRTEQPAARGCSDGCESPGQVVRCAIVSKVVATSLIAPPPLTANFPASFFSGASSERLCIRRSEGKRNDRAPIQILRCRLSDSDQLAASNQRKFFDAALLI